MTDQFELTGGMGYTDYDDSNVSFNVGGRYYFTDMFALGAGVDLDDDVTVWSMGVRWDLK